MPTNKTYTLTTIADLLRVVTMDNVDALAADIRGLLKNAAATKSLIAVTNPKDAEALFNEIIPIEWCDDNINRQRIILDFGEDKAIEFVTKGKKHK